MGQIQGVGARLLRVSTDRQDTERQLRDIERWERQQGVQASLEFEDKESRLLSERREEFQRLLTHVDNRTVNWVVIQSTDRLGFKHTFELFEILGRFLRNGVRLYTACDGRCLTSTDDFTVIMNAVSGQTSQKELVEKAQRVQTKRILKGRAGQFHGGMPPYGFDVICKDAAGKLKWRFVQSGRKKGRWLKGQVEEEVTGLPPHDRTAHETLWLAPSIIRERVETLERIFRIFDTESISTLQIARRLNAEGVSPVLAAKWEHSKIWALLQNPAVIGRPASNKVTMAKIFAVEGDQLVSRSPLDPFKRHARENWLMPAEAIFEPVVEEDRFWRCCKKLHAQQGHRAPKNENLLLSGLLHCGKCGKKMSGQYKAKTSGGKRVPGYYSYYRCQTYMVHKDTAGNTTGCRNHGTLQETVMPYVHEFLESRGKTLADLLSSRGDSKALVSLIRERRAKDGEIRGVVAKMQQFIMDALSGTGTDYPCHLDDESLDAHTPLIVDLYDQVFTVQRRELEAELAGFEAQHTEMTTQYFRLPPKAQEKALGQLTALEGKIASAKSRLEPLLDRWQDLIENLGDLKKRLAEARLALAKGSLRQQAQALRNALDRIEVHYEPKGAKHSRLALVRIVPLVGSPQDYEVSSAVSDCTGPGPPSRRSRGRGTRRRG